MRKDYTIAAMLYVTTAAIPIGLIAAAPVMRGQPSVCETRTDFIIGEESGKARLGEIEECRRGPMIVSRRILD